MCPCSTYLRFLGLLVILGWQPASPPKTGVKRSSTHNMMDCGILNLSPSKQAPGFRLTRTGDKLELELCVKPVTKCHASSMLKLRLKTIKRRFKLSKFIRRAAPMPKSFNFTYHRAQNCAPPEDLITKLR